VNVPPFGDAISETKKGTIITIEVTAGGKRDVFPAGYNGWRKTIGCSVAAPAVDGKANRAVVATIAQTLHLPESAVQIQSGTKSPIKRVLIQGKNKSELIYELESVIQSSVVPQKILADVSEDIL
jgi:uncharacterized protein (TIGR00251 family)